MAVTLSFANSNLDALLTTAGSPNLALGSAPATVLAPFADDSADFTVGTSPRLTIPTGLAAYIDDLTVTFTEHTAGSAREWAIAVEGSSLKSLTIPTTIDSGTGLGWKPTSSIYSYDQADWMSNFSSYASGVETAMNTKAETAIVAGAKTILNTTTSAGKPTNAFVQAFLTRALKDAATTLTVAKFLAGTTDPVSTATSHSDNVSTDYVISKAGSVVKGYVSAIYFHGALTGGWNTGIPNPVKVNFTAGKSVLKITL
jgi:hypothetical protein